MALPTYLASKLGVPVPKVTENLETAVPGHENNNIRLYELFDVDFDPSALANGDSLVFSSSSKKFQKAIGSKVAAVPPTANDDLNDGYVIGSMWTNTVGPELYVATSVASAAAVWLQLI